MIFCNEQLLQRVTSDFLERTTSARSNEQILQRVTSDFTMSNNERVNFNEERATCKMLRSYSFLVCLALLSLLGYCMYVCLGQCKLFNIKKKKKQNQKQKATSGEFPFSLAPYSLFCFRPAIPSFVVSQFTVSHTNTSVFNI